MNRLFKSYQETQANQNPPANLNSMLQGLAQQIMHTGMNAEQIVRQMMQNNQISQEQFEWAAKIADRWTGGRR